MHHAPRCHPGEYQVGWGGMWDHDERVFVIVSTGEGASTCPCRSLESSLRCFHAHSNLNYDQDVAQREHFTLRNSQTIIGAVHTGQ